MYSASPSAPSGGFMSWLRRAEAWLDQKGKPAWVITMVLGFILAWPVGLALLAYLIWSKKMFRGSDSCGGRREGRFGRHRHGGHSAWRSSGNTAFDSYKSDMLQRLEEEQRAFEGFLQRLRDAKDKSEFDAFMEDRARATAEAATTPPPEPPVQEGRAGAY
jgi:hypothetical protein